MNDDSKAGTKVEAAEAKAQTVVDKETAQGFRGVEVDSTPNENYTAKGVAAGKPVPEAAPNPRAARASAANI